MISFTNTAKRTPKVSVLAELMLTMLVWAVGGSLFFVNGSQPKPSRQARPFLGKFFGISIKLGYDKWELDSQKLWLSISRADTKRPITIT